MQLTAHIYCLQIRHSGCEYLQSSLEYFGRNFTSSVMVANPDLINNGGIFVFNHLHKVNQNLTLGFEVFSQVTQRGSMAAKALIAR